jgi:outer membrane protein W
MSLTLELDNQHREQKGIGVLGNVGVSAGTLSVTANASQYFEDLDQSTKFKNSTAFAFSYRFQDNAGNSYIFTLPRSKYETFAASASGENSDIMAETSFAATRDPVTNCMVQIDRFSA